MQEKKYYNATQKNYVNATQKTMSMQEGQCKEVTITLTQNSPLQLTLTRTTHRYSDNSPLLGQLTLTRTTHPYSDNSPLLGQLTLTRTTHPPRPAQSGQQMSC
jgi:hypothetical protein